MYMFFSEKTNPQALQGEVTRDVWGHGKGSGVRVRGVAFRDQLEEAAMEID